MPGNMYVYKRVVVVILSLASSNLLPRHFLSVGDAESVGDLDRNGKLVRRGKSQMSRSAAGEKCYK